MMYHSEDVAGQDDGDEEDDPLDAFMAGVEVCV